MAKYLAVLAVLIGSMSGQSAPKTDSNKVILDSNVTSTMQGNLVLSSPDIDNVAVTCESWKPRPTKCQIADGKTLDDLTAAMMSWYRDQAAELRALQEENDGWIAQIQYLQNKLDALQKSAKPKPIAKAH